MSALQASFWHQRRVVILGAGRSGVAAACFLRSLGNTVFVSDQGKISDSIKQELNARGIAWEEQGHSLETLKQAEAMIISPGIPLTAQPVRLAQAEKIPVISEIELAGQFLKTPVIAVTGSNGKTTTVTLLHTLLQTAGYHAELGGNIGTPLISFVNQPLDWIVAEISSFQLETTFTFRPHIGIFLNLYPNHLDRHLTMERYFQIKARLFQAQQAGDKALSNRDNPWCQKLPEYLQKDFIWFSRQAGPDILSWIDQHQLWRQGSKGPEAVIALKDLPLLGSHNHENYLALLAVSSLLNIPLVVLQQTITKVPGIPHRLEKIAEFNGRIFINDSKATNYLATMKAIESLSPPVILIAGGRDKGGDFTPLAKLIQRRVKHVILIGEAAQTFMQQIRTPAYHQVSMADSLQEAVALAWKISVPGDQILLSPACSSYDMFANFEERGEKFKACVAALSR